MEGFEGGGIEVRVQVAALGLAVEFAGEFIGADAIDRFGAEKGGDLLLGAQEALQGLPNTFLRDMLIWEGPVHLLLQVVRRRGGAEADAGDVLLVVVLEFLRPFAGRADAH